MFDPGSRRSLAPLPGVIRPIFVKLLPPAALHRDLPVNFKPFAFRAEAPPPSRRPTARGRHFDAVRQPRLLVHADVKRHAEAPPASFVIERISRSLAGSLFFVELGASMIVASMMCPSTI